MTLFQKDIAWINLDETSLQRDYADGKGTAVRRAWYRCNAGPTRRRAKRGNITLIALSSPLAEVQARLPQFFVGNRFLFSKRSLEAIESDVPSNLHFWRRQSSWNSTEVMLEVLDEVARVMASFPDKQPCLIMDSASMHYNKRVCLRAAFLGLWIIIIPSQTTGHLQPLDLQTFSCLKQHLRRKSIEAAVASDADAGTGEAWLRLLFAVSDFMTSRSWYRGFEAAGIVGDRRNLGGPLAPPYLAITSARENGS